MAACDDINVRIDDVPHPCGKCKEVKDVNVPAVKYCLQCSIWMCGNCLEGHEFFFKVHTLSDSPSCSVPSTKPCSVHKDMNVMYFCLSCKECVCPVCRVDDGAHKAHDCISIGERIYAVREEVTEAIAALKMKEEKADEQITALNHDLSAVSVRSRELEKRVKQEIRNLAEEHQRQKKKSEEELLEKKKSSVNEIKKLQKYLTDADAAIGLTDTSSLRDEVNSPLPKLPEFREGLHEAGLRIMLGEKLTHQNKTDVSKLLKHEAASEDVQDAPAVLDHNISSLSSLNLDHCQISSALKHWNIKPSSLTGKQAAGLIRKGTRVKHAVVGYGLGTARCSVNSDKCVVVDWDCGYYGCRYKMGADDVYSLTLAD